MPDGAASYCMSALLIIPGIDIVVVTPPLVIWPWLPMFMPPIPSELDAAVELGMAADGW